MYKILLASTALVGLTLSGLPAQAASSFWSKEGVIRVGRAIMDCVLQRPQMDNDEALDPPESIGESFYQKISLRDDRPTRLIGAAGLKALFEVPFSDSFEIPLSDINHSSWWYSFGTRTYGDDSFGTGTQMSLSHLQRQNQFIGAVGLKDLFEDQSSHSMPRNSLELRSVEAEEAEGHSEAQGLSDNHRKLPPIDVWPYQFNFDHATQYVLPPLSRTAQHHMDADVLDDCLSVEEAQKLSHSQLKHILLKTWAGQLEDD